MTYNWEQKDWLQFRYNESEFTEIALQFIALAEESHLEIPIKFALIIVNQ